MKILPISENKNQKRTFLFMSLCLLLCYHIPFFNIITHLFDAANIGRILENSKFSAIILQSALSKGYDCGMAACILLNLS